MRKRDGEREIERERDLHYLFDIKKNVYKIKWSYMI